MAAAYNYVCVYNSSIWNQVLSAAIVSDFLAQPQVNPVGGSQLFLDMSGMTDTQVTAAILTITDATVTTVWALAVAGASNNGQLSSTNVTNLQGKTTVTAAAAK